MKQWQVIRVECSDIFSYGTKSVADFEPDQSYLVVGDNRDSAGSNSNGAGKSSFADAVTWAIFGQTARKISVDDVIRRGADRASVCVTLSNGIDTLVITRTRRTSGKVTIDIDLNGGSISDELRTVTDTQEYLYRFFGFPEPSKAFVDYLSQVYFTESSSKGFLSTTIAPSERQDILERHLGLGRLDGARDLAKADYKKVDDELKVIASQIAQFPDNLVEQYMECETKHKACASKITEFDIRISSLNQQQIRLREILHDIMPPTVALDHTKEEIEAVRGKMSKIQEQYKAARRGKKEALELREQWSKLEAEFTGKTSELSKVNAELAQLSEKKLEAFGEYTVQLDVVGAVESDLRDLNTRKTNILDAKKRFLLQIKTSDSSCECPKCGAKVVVSNAPDELCGFRLELFDSKDFSEDSAKFDTDIESINSEIAKCTAVFEEEKEKADVLKAAYNKIEGTLSLTKSKQRVPLETRLTELENLKRRVDKIDFSELDAIEKRGWEVQNEFDRLEKQEHTQLLRKNEILSRYRAEFNMIVNQYNGISVVLSVESCEEWAKDVSTKLTVTQRDREAVVLERAALESQMEQIVDKQKQLTALESSRKMKLKHRVEFEYWYRKFPEIKRAILRNFVPVFEKETNRCLADLQVPERVKFRLVADKKKAGDGLKVGFNIHVLDGARQWRDFETYSNGEKSRILVSVGFALRQLSLERIGDSGFGFLFCDEVLDDLDQVGVRYFTKLSARIGGQRFIITHAHQNDVATLGFDKQLVVVKEDNQSYFEVA